MKQKKCATCAELFTPQRMGQIACSPHCAYQTVLKKKKKEYDADTKLLKQKLLNVDKRRWSKFASRVCHKYIRMRDAGEPCISCGRNHTGQIHAGHYRPSGINSALRFDERNIHAQCSPCNLHLSGNLTGYRQGLVKKIGEDAVKELEENHDVKRWTIPELKEVIEYYKAKLKVLNDESIDSL